MPRRLGTNFTLALGGHAECRSQTLVGSAKASPLAGLGFRGIGFGFTV